ncbi:hypothetical protein AKJ09_09239 [Labilithrix luteola]|uniref:Uncharacterized protein n=1 Tax=Labilithrix luteola TaxID=1391654 RepID=A0A0K1Q9V9_9BACT|nr:hypothetical protein [Labilithrix luteola]AKV02576.1 hypothetical protein AKJ09_09239 [Labilithrix luteola]
MSAKTGRGLFFRIRVGILLTILFFVVLYAVRDFRSRNARKDWKTTLDVAVVLLRAGPVDDDAVRRPASEERSFIEGRSEESGRIGVVTAELDTSMADLLLVVTAHELMHTLGASDRYDSTRRTLIPAGLAEPDRMPLYPQRFAEIMARNRVIAPGRETVPESIDQLVVGAQTAAEIGWTPAP